MCDSMENMSCNNKFQYMGESEYLDALGKFEFNIYIYI